MLHSLFNPDETGDYGKIDELLDNVGVSDEYDLLHFYASIESGPFIDQIPATDAMSFPGTGYNSQYFQDLDQR